MLFWVEDDGLSVNAARYLEGLGYRVTPFLYNRAIPEGVDIVAINGPFNSLAPLCLQLISRRREQRPAVVFTHTEQFPNFNLPEWLRRPFSHARSAIERSGYLKTGAEWTVRPGFRPLLTKAHRYRYYGDLFWMRRTGILSALIVHSEWTAALLRRRGFDVLVPPMMGLSADWGQDLALTRDIPVLWLGKIGSSRRRNLLRQLRADLQQRGLDLYMVDGEENPYIFGDERTRLLNRTRIMVNILREPWDDNSMRYYLAAANGCLIITEPTLPHTRLLRGKHLIEVPVHEMGDTICRYLDNEPERSRIARQASEWMATPEMTAPQWTRKVFQTALEFHRNETSNRAKIDRL